MYVLLELGYVSRCQDKEKNKECTFENALVEKNKSLKSNEFNGLVKNLYLYPIKMFTFTDLSFYINSKYISVVWN